MTKRDPGSSKKNNASDKLLQNSNYRHVLNLLENLLANGPVAHPKAEKIKMIALEHFTPKPGVDQSSSRMMVFASYRDYVEELVEFLNQEQPLLRATQFIGQGSDVRGRKGMQQKEQLNVGRSFTLSA